MEEVILQAEQRQKIGKQVKALRREGKVPAVLYGYGIDPLPVSLNAKEANRVLSTISSSQLVTIDLAGESHRALVRERQRNAIYGYLLHVDFLVVSMTETLRTNVPVELVGESPAVKEYGGYLVSGVEVLEVECLPDNLPERFLVDVSGMIEIGSTITVGDLIVPEGVEILVDADEVLAVVTAPAAAEEAEEEEELEDYGEEPKVIDRGKQEEEDF